MSEIQRHRATRAFRGAQFDCCDLSGACRPDTFTAPAGTRRFLVSYRRP